ncbi:MAG: response regulator [Deltaproteobacteria bacterium]|nr:response regulator [Deltaproteobacteria bacterium]
MNERKHTILCVDDEESILHSLKRLLRKESYRMLTASSGEEGLDLLSGNEVHLVLSDQRMPGMNGTEFLAKVKENYPDTIRIVLTGYTEVDSITGSINKGHIYKFILKPWNNQNLKLEIKQGLDQYDLVKSNKSLHKRVLQQNEELKNINNDLEKIVKERTMDLEIQNQALELSHAILEDLPIPIIGISNEMIIVLINSKVQELSVKDGHIAVGKKISECLSREVEEKIANVFKSNTSDTYKKCRLGEEVYNVDFMPLSGRFRGKGIVLALNSSKEEIPK